jgi:hypothetical protein
MRLAEKRLRVISSRIDESEALIASCRALAQSDVVTRSAEFDSNVHRLDEYPDKDFLIDLLRYAIVYHPNPDEFEKGVHDRQTTIASAKVEWKKSGISEEDGRLVSEELERDDGEVSVRCESLLRARRHLADMEIAFLDFQKNSRAFFNTMSERIDPLIVRTYNEVLTYENTPEQQVTLDSMVVDLNHWMLEALVLQDDSVVNSEDFDGSAARFRELML